MAAKFINKIENLYKRVTKHQADDVHTNANVTNIKRYPVPFEQKGFSSSTSNKMKLM